MKAAAQPRYASGGIFEGEWKYGHGLVGEDCHGGFVLSPSQSVALRKVMDAPMTRGPVLTIQMGSRSPAEIPNRLYGAQINHEGDAI
jgi:hypothetical protein